MPVIGSLNGTTEGGWLRYARLIEQAGADGLELNLYELAIDPARPGEDGGTARLEVVRAVKGSVKIPVAVKLSPFYSSIANFARRLDEAGADALVLFNRFYQPDIDVERAGAAARQPVQPGGAAAAAALDRRAVRPRRASLAATGGVHRPSTSSRR